MKRKILYYATDEEGIRRFESFHPDSSIVLWMSPQKFLDLTGGEKFPLSSQSYNKIMERLKRRLPLDPLFIDVKRYGDKWKVVSHEGRHRALASKALGIRNVPVFIYFRDESGHYINVPWKFPKEILEAIVPLI